ncbi:MAG TPA: SDR family NAD(P)-dependent oxidoreductase [Thermoanaerobaculia bacterium]|nr:SDR family NAD(P)-dependent oxidoreductase [Thermoanaerobaculia bacterium]
MDWQGQVVWITGASSGIGEALAYALARRGARLILSARNRERLVEVAAVCNGQGRPGGEGAGEGAGGEGAGGEGAGRGEPGGAGGHLVLPLDLGDAGSIADAAERALALCGHIDVLVHNGAVSQRAYVRDTLPEVERRIFETNFWGPVALTRAVLPSMLSRRQGRIVVVASFAGKIAIPRGSAYCASKHALHGYFGALRTETWDAGLRVTIVCPGGVRTAISLSALTADGSPYAAMDRAQAAGMSPARCAEAIVAAVESGRQEVLIGRKRWMVYAYRLVPELYLRMAVSAFRRAFPPAAGTVELQPAPTPKDTPRGLR